MSIYCSLDAFKIQKYYGGPFVEVYIQAVPPYIGHISHYDNDPYADFLPPVVKDYDPYDTTNYTYRAVFFIQLGREQKEGQRYLDPLFMLTGEEFKRATFIEIMDRVKDTVK